MVVVCLRLVEFAELLEDGVDMDGRQRLAQLFGDWVDRHGYTQGEVAAMGGPSTTTQTKVRYSDGPVSRQTMRQLDQVLGWPAGTTAGVLRGLPAPEGVGPVVDSVSAAPDTDDSLLFVRPPGVTDQEWIRIKDEAQGYIEWQIEKVRRELG